MSSTPELVAYAHQSSGMGDDALIPVRRADLWSVGGTHRAVAEP